MANLVTEYRCAECGKRLKSVQGLVQHARMKHDAKLSKEEALQGAVEIDYDKVPEPKRTVLQRLGFTEFHPVLLIVGLLILALGIPGACHITRKYRRKADATTSWPNTKGVILSSKVKEPPRSSSGSGRTQATHVPRIRYTYTVNGRKYEGSRHTIGHVKGKTASEELVARFPKGKIVTVYYDPKDPSQAVLVRGMGGSNPFRYGMLLVVIMGLFFVVVAFRKNTG
jgi:hypothetical protein